MKTTDENSHYQLFTLVKLGGVLEHELARATEKWWGPEPWTRCKSMQIGDRRGPNGLTS